MPTNQEKVIISASEISKTLNKSLNAKLAEVVKPLKLKEKKMNLKLNFVRKQIAFNNRNVDLDKTFSLEEDNIVEERLSQEKKSEEEQ